MNLKVKSACFGLKEFRHLFIDYQIHNEKYNDYREKSLRSFDITLETLNQLQSISKDIYEMTHEKDYNQMKRGYYGDECFVISYDKDNDKLILEIYNGYRE